MRACLITCVVLVLASGPVGPRAPVLAGPEPQSEETSEELEEFVPSEEVGAGAAIAFPVDI